MKPKLALVQHPMYLLIQEDTQCAERIPPWGAPDIDTYLDRLERNLRKMRDTPELKLGYEWSAVELELLYERNVNLFQEMCDLVREGSCTFYNGTYSQPHLQILSSEANYRQFEYGSKVYRELCGARVVTYAHQETSVHEQLPQLLDAFGIKYVTMPEFISTLIIQTDFEMLYHGDLGPLLVEESGMVDWKGIDNTTIPLYLQQKTKGQIGTWLEYQEMLGLQHSPSIYLEIPDMEEIDDEWMEARSGAEFVILDEALESELARRPNRPTARLFTNWSYAEGIRAEELSRCNLRAEEAALTAEVLGAAAKFLVGREPVSTDKIWKQILLTQHHDVYCFCGPEIKQKSIEWLNQAMREADGMADDAAKAILSELNPSNAEGKPLAVFNTAANPVKSVVTTPIPGDSATVFDPEGSVVASDVQTRISGEKNLRFIAESEGVGYTVYRIVESESESFADVPTVISNHNEAYTFENSHFRMVVEPNGTFSSLRLADSNDELLGGYANVLRATDSFQIERGSKVAPERLGQGFGAAHSTEWFTEGRGPELEWRPTGAAEVAETPLGVVISINGILSDNAGARMIVKAYHELPYITVQWRFEFDSCSIGTFFDDDSKLRLQIPMAFDGSVYHDIPFGYVETKRGRPFFPTTWMDFSDDEMGLAYLHRGTPKHWVNGNLIENLFAWGEFTDAIGNRVRKIFWGKSFDQRLTGSHTIEYALYPHSGGTKATELAALARSFAAPMRAYPLDGTGSGELPERTTIFAIENPAVIATSIFSRSEEEGVSCRLFSVGEDREEIAIRSDYQLHASLASLKGDDMSVIKPFQIGTLKLAKRATQ